MEKEVKSKYYIFMVILCAVFFACGYKIGDATGYNDGYEMGYRFDCKEEIGLIYQQVKAQGVALNYTDSTIKKVMRVNDSLMHKEYFQKRFAESVKRKKQYIQDSIKYSSFVKRYNDSIAEYLGTVSTNFITDDGRVNVLMCMSASSPYSSLKECECFKKSENKNDPLKLFDALESCDDYFIKRFDSMKKTRKKGRK